MRKFMFVAAALGALVQPAFAESIWERLDRGLEVVSECAGDVAKQCKGVTPGGGRIKDCMLGHLNDMSTQCLTALAGPKSAVFSDG
ncbi:MAG: hypothetical protein MUC37_14120, partial [Hyphomicrobium sp.]|nr:hypothetical protein [Hyphomicrobium sp.]